MKVEIWADVVCPWCGLGARRLDKALARLGDDVDVEVVRRSYPLDPSSPPGQVRPVAEVLMAKYGLDPAQVAASSARIEALAAAEGLVPYVVGANRTGNTVAAHQLLALAADRDRSRAAWDRLFAAYFGEARSIFDLDSLAGLGAEIGLDPAEVRDTIGSERYVERIVDDVEAAHALGARGVPFVAVDGVAAIAGARSVDDMVEVLGAAAR